MTSTVNTLSELQLRLQRVRSRMHAAAQRSNRSVEEITLVAVSKTHPADLIRQAIAAGATDFGENRVQEAETKITEIGKSAGRWHLIGHLQSNKARRAVQLFDVIHSLDSAELARKLDRACAQDNRDTLSVMIQVDLGHEATKTGAEESELPDIFATVSKCEHLRLSGLMTLPPFFADAEQARPYFVRLRELRDELRGRGMFGSGRGELSMGMTNDFEVAIEEGATLVRVGTAIFGEREQQ